MGNREAGDENRKAHQDDFFFRNPKLFSAVERVAKPEDHSGSDQEAEKVELDPKNKRNLGNGREGDQELNNTCAFNSACTGFFTGGRAA